MPGPLQVLRMISAHSSIGSLGTDTVQSRHAYGTQTPGGAPQSNILTAQALGSSSLTRGSLHLLRCRRDAARHAPALLPAALKRLPATGCSALFSSSPISRDRFPQLPVVHRNRCHTRDQRCRQPQHLQSASHISFWSGQGHPDEAERCAAPPLQPSLGRADPQQWQCDVVQLHLQDRLSLRGLVTAVVLGHVSAWAMVLPCPRRDEALGSAVQPVH